MKTSGLITLFVLGLSACFGVTGESQSLTNASDVLPTPPKTGQIKNESVIPIMETNIGGLLGGVKNGEWLSAKDTAAQLKGGEIYKIFSLTNTGKSQFTGESPTSGVPCEDFYSIATNPEQEIDAVALGASLDWNPAVRSVAKLENNSVAYKKIISETLASKGLAKSIPKATQIFQTDMDGDGVNEVVISTSSFKKGLTSRANVGDYSFILLRKVVNGKAKNFVLSGDFVAKASNADAPSEYKISGIADLNGDGKMEIIVYARYYEGNWVEVFEMKNDNIASVEKLKSACGV
jgi:hypothetical protein